MADPGKNAAAVFLYAGLFDVALGLGFLLWGERIPSLEAVVPGALGLSLAKITGLALLLAAAPASFFLYFLRRRQAAAQNPRSSGPVTRL